MWFRDNMYEGQWSFGWNKLGIRKEVLWALARDKFFSHKQYSNWDARNTGKTDWYFMSKQNTKKMYQDYISKEMAKNTEQPVQQNLFEEPTVAENTTTEQVSQQTKDTPKETSETTKNTGEMQQEQV